jgi:hypothetical protein
VKDQEVKQHLLISGMRSLNEVLNQVPKLEAASSSWIISKDVGGKSPEGNVDRVVTGTA